MDSVNYTNDYPQFISCEKYLGQKRYTINFNIKELKEDKCIEGYLYSYNTITLSAGQYDRSTVISAVIRQRYSDDEMQAIINNYLLDPNDAEAVAEFNQMQQYRKFAKSLADDFEKAIAQD